MRVLFNKILNHCNLIHHKVNIKIFIIKGEEKVGIVVICEQEYSAIWNPFDDLVRVQVGPRQKDGDNDLMVIKYEKSKINFKQIFFSNYYFNIKNYFIVATLRMGQIPLYA